MTKRKCLKCGLEFDIDKIPYVVIFQGKRKRYAHEVCPIKDEDISSEQKLANEKDAFFQVVKRIYGPKYNYMMINSQCESYIATYGYTWSGMRACLHWFYEINHGSLEEGHGGVGIIPFIYDQVRDYYIEVYRTQEQNKNKELRKSVIEFNIQSPQASHRPPHLLNLD